VFEQFPKFTDINPLSFRKIAVQVKVSYRLLHNFTDELIFIVLMGVNYSEFDSK
jgi:hypothetical protein